MFFVYRILINIFILISPFLILIRIIKKKEDKIRFIEKFAISSKKRPKGSLIWFHCASVGETMSVIPLIKYFEKNININNILLTTSTISSANLVKKYKFKKLIHQFYPIDHTFLTNKFLKYWKPNVAIFLESEIWPNMFNNLKKYEIDLVLLNARITKKTFDNWMLFKKSAIKIFRQIKFAFPQNKETEKYLKTLKINNIKFTGNLKFIENKSIFQNKLFKEISQKFKSKKIWVAASTHKGEEKIAAYVHMLMKKKIKNLVTIIIPRHIDRVQSIKRELRQLNLSINIHSKNKNLEKDTDIYLVDTFGESEVFYKLASTVFLGKSIMTSGGQNPLEPCRFGSRILHGPNTGNFKEIYILLKKLKISSKVVYPNDFIRNIKFKKDFGNAKKIKQLGIKVFEKNIIELNKIINDTI